MESKLSEALLNPVWASHKIGDEYAMEGRNGLWKIAYYPIFEDGKSKEEYAEARALVEAVKPLVIAGVVGIDFVEVPMRYLSRV